MDVNDIERRPLNQPEQNWVGCAACLNQRGKRVPATVTVNGVCVCDAHVELASRADFTIDSLRTGGRHVT